MIAKRLAALAAVLLLAGCIELKILAPETVRRPEPRPACGETGRAYAPPRPGPVSPATASAMASNGPVPR